MTEKKETTLDKIDNICGELREINILLAMKMVHAANMTKYSDAEIDYLAEIASIPFADEESDDEDGAVDDEPHSWADVAHEILCPDCYENFVKKYGASHITRAQLEEAIGHPLGDSPDLRVPNLKKN